MTAQDDQRLVYEMASRLSRLQGLELVEIKLGRHRHDVLIQVLADKPQGGIRLEDCSVLHRSLVEAIDKEGILSEDGYSLEVSSPGLDRPLVTYKDFLRNISKEIHLWLKERNESKFEYTGIITAATQESLTLLTPKEKKEITVPINQIIKGLLVI